MAAKHSYVFHLLDYLRDGRPHVADEIRRYLSKVRRSPRDLEEVLRSLQEIGVVRNEGEGRWISAAAQPQAGGGTDGPPRGGTDGPTGGGTDGPTGRRASGGDGNREGGRGLAEVLAHPVLLCLSVNAQESLLDTAFDVGPTGEVSFT